MPNGQSGLKTGETVQINGVTPLPHSEYFVSGQFLIQFFYTFWLSAGSGFINVDVLRIRCSWKDAFYNQTGE